MHLRVISRRARGHSIETFTFNKSASPSHSVQCYRLDSLRSQFVHACVNCQISKLFRIWKLLYKYIFQHQRVQSLLVNREEENCTAQLSGDTVIPRVIEALDSRKDSRIRAFVENSQEKWNDVHHVKTVFLREVLHLGVIPADIVFGKIFPARSATNILF